jgi:DHA1 family inner membrane transport protein
VVSFSHGSFFGLAAIIAVSLVTPDRRGSALSLVFAGISVANIVGVPIGTAIGNAWGWRATFWVVAGLAVVAAAAMALALPRDAARQQGGATIADQFRVLGNPQVYLTYAIIVVFMIGFFAFFTFVAPYLTAVAGVPHESVPWLLLLFGVGSTIGIFVGGRLGDRRAAETLLIAFPVQALVWGAILLFSGNATTMAFLLFAVGATGMVTNTSLQNRILSGAAAAPDLAATLISSVFNLGIAIGAYAGATALQNGVAYAQLPWLGFVCTLLTAGLTVFAISVDRRAALAPQPA